MKPYEFTLQLEGVYDPDDELDFVTEKIRGLGWGWDDSIVCGNGRVYVMLQIKAESLNEAVISAIAQLKTINIKVAFVETQDSDGVMVAAIPIENEDGTLTLSTI